MRREDELEMNIEFRPWAAGLAHAGRFDWANGRPLCSSGQVRHVSQQLRSPFSRHHLRRKSWRWDRVRRRRLPATDSIGSGRHPGRARPAAAGRLAISPTQRREPDEARILSGVMIEDRSGRQVTTGTPIGVFIENVDQRSKDYSEIKDKYRPGHADYAYDAKYGIRDYRGGGRSSARETAAGVAAGAIARKVTPGVTVRGALVQMGNLKIDRTRWDWDEVGRNPFFCPDAAAAERFADRRYPQGGLLDRRGHRSSRRGRSCRLGRADLW